MRKSMIWLAALALLWGSCASTDYFLRSKSEDERRQPLAALKIVRSEPAVPRYAEFVSPLVPRLAFRGELAVRAGEDYAFNVQEAGLFDNWANGWTEGAYEASGTFLLRKREGGWSASLEDGFRLWSIKSGEIRFYDAYHRREDGLKKVKQRVERMIELSLFMRKSLSFRPVYAEAAGRDASLSAFREDALRLLFPERAGFEELEKSGRLAPGFRAVPGTAFWVRGDDLPWRTDYSAAVLPENLRELRNSGTLYRDFEEAAGLWLSLYNVEGLSELLRKEELFIRLEEKG